MSARLMGAAFYVRIPTSEKFLLLALCDHANDDGHHIWPGQARLSVKVDLTPRRIRQLMVSLKDRGLVERLRGSAPGRGSEYRIDIGRMAQLAREGEAEVKRRQSVAPVDESTAEIPDERRQSQALTAAIAISSKPSVEPSVEPSGKKRSVVLSDDQFLAQLAKLYPGLDVAAELRKMDAWLLTPKGRGRKKTRAFVVNWLNKCDPPMRPAGQGGPGARVRLEDLTAAERDQVAVEQRVRPGASLEEVLPIVRRALAARAAEA